MTNDARSPVPQTSFDDTDQQAVVALRMLAADMIQKAVSGHPGGAMSLSDIAYVLWTRFLVHDPTEPRWPDRDRFVLSGGHISSLFYALLGMYGYLPREEWRRFRQLDSLTPGHPEHTTPGVEVTTGPLGQGLAVAVGMALAERFLRGHFGPAAQSHFTYATIGDGDVEEGISAEAAGIAGRQALGRLIVFYDDNRVQIDGSTALALSDDVGARFAAQGWHIQHVDGHDRAALAEAILAAQAETGRPSLIVARTVIARGTATREGDYKTHGEPLGDAEIRATKAQWGQPPDETFYVPPAVEARFAALRGAATARAAARRAETAAWAAREPEQAQTLADWFAGVCPPLGDLQALVPAAGKVATRAAGASVLKALGERVPNLFGGAADLLASVKIDGLAGKSGAATPENPAGRLLHFGVREFSMTAILNGLALHGGVRPIGSTFLVFADYMKPAIRLACLMGLPVTYVLTHDSIGVGEDGPTHQPIEQLPMLRCIPGMTVLRPADAAETAAAWRYILEAQHGPVALLLTRQNVPVLPRLQIDVDRAVARGAYVIDPDPTGGLADVTLIATGSEVAPCLGAAALLRGEGLRVRVVSFPSWERFEAQPETYRHGLFGGPETPDVRLVVEAAQPQGWERYAGPLGAIVGIRRFGASAPEGELMRVFGFTADNIAHEARQTLARARALAPQLAAALCPIGRGKRERG